MYPANTPCFPALGYFSLITQHELIKDDLIPKPVPLMTPIPHFLFEEGPDKFL